MHSYFIKLEDRLWKRLETVRDEVGTTAAEIVRQALERHLIETNLNELYPSMSGQLLRKTNS